MSTIPTSAPESWSRALSDPQLRDLAYKIETNEHNQLVLTPHKAGDSFHQGSIAERLRRELPGGTIAPELAVATPWGVKVPDVIWISAERRAQIPDDAEASAVMPELVVEVLSTSNTRGEIEEKRRIYFAGGAEEVWTCDPDGRMGFYDRAGEMEASKLAPNFPGKV